MKWEEKMIIRLANSDLKDQVAFLKEIGRLNNGGKHPIWKKR